MTYYFRWKQNNKKMFGWWKNWKKKLSRIILMKNLICWVDIMRKLINMIVKEINQNMKIKINIIYFLTF
jgi:hypothetical protein